MPVTPAPSPGQSRPRSARPYCQLGHLPTAPSSFPMHDQRVGQLVTYFKARHATRQLQPNRHAHAGSLSVSVCAHELAQVALARPSTTPTLLVCYTPSLHPPPTHLHAREEGMGMTFLYGGNNSFFFALKGGRKHVIRVGHFSVKKER